MSPAPRARVVAGLVATVLLAVYGARAVSGVWGGLAYFRAAPLVEEGQYELALPLLRRAAVGEDRGEALLLRAEVQRGLWRVARREGESSPERASMLSGAAADLLEAGWSMPAAGWPWAGLADIYDRIERERRGLESDVRLADQGSWNDLGREGAVAVGLVRRALERHGSDFAFWDQLAVILLRLGLRPEGLEAVREAARANPQYSDHPFPYLVPETSSLMESFARGAREALGSAPMIDRRSHLVAIGKLEMRMGSPAEAEGTLREALELGGRSVTTAFVRYWLGQALVAQGRYDEAEVEFVAAAEQPGFKVAAWEQRAEIAERRGESEQALAFLRQARWADPTRLGVCLRFAETAGRLERWPEALEALEWAALMHPEDPRPSLLRVDALYRSGEVGRALQALQQHERSFGPSPQTESIRATLAFPERKQGE